MSSLLDMANLDVSSTPGQLPPHLRPEAPAPSPIRTAQAARIIHSHHTEVLVQAFADRIFVLVTQLGRIGSLIQINPPPPAAPSPISLSTLSSPSLFPELPSPHPSITLQPIFGVPPSPHMESLYDLYANQIGAIVFEGMKSEDGFGAELPVLLGIGLKVARGEDEGVTQSDRETFGEVMRMVAECQVW